LIPKMNEAIDARIIVLCSGGIVSTIYCSQPAKIDVLDYDTDDLDDPELSEWEVREEALVRETHDLLQVY
jgi:S-adenosylmethionine:diacylglycerol 3-amino-3-carboxypropyl transferase